MWRHLDRQAVQIRIMLDYWSGDEQISWETLQTSATGVIDWSDSSYSDDIAGSETLFTVMR